MKKITKKDFIIGVDSSTTAAKAIVWDKKGNCVVEAREDIPLLTPHTDWVEQRAGDWWDATAKSIYTAVQHIDPNRIAAIGITHQRESFVPLNKELNPVRNGILWTDTRTTTQVKWLRDKCGEKVHKITGRFPNLYASNVKIMWIRENEPAIFKNIYKYLDVAAYLYLKLTGKFVTTWPSACPMGIVDISNHCWSKEILDLHTYTSSFP
ncbi:Glycerol kinase [subsurface metagenome]